MNTLPKFFIAVFFLFFQYSFAQWKEIESDLNTKTNTFNSLIFSSSTTGWVQANMNIYKTVNSGKNWNLFSLRCGNGMPIGYNYISFADSANGWILRNDTLYHTVDGGTGWTPIKLPLDNFKMISFQTAKRGVAFAGNVPYFSIDCGNTWEKAQIGELIGVADIQFTDSLLGWICGPGPAIDAGSILTTEDGGKSWRFLLKDFYEYERIWATDSKHIIVGGTRSMGRISFINTTFDGGKTWIDTIIPNGCSHIVSLDSCYGIAVSSIADSMILQTTDGGKTWNTINEIKHSFGIGATIFKNTLYIVTHGLLIYKYDKPTTAAAFGHVPIINPQRSVYEKDLFVGTHFSPRIERKGVSLIGQTINRFNPGKAPAIMIIKRTGDN